LLLFQIEKTQCRYLIIYLFCRKHR
jgi:hypothetical protein